MPAHHQMARICCDLRALWSDADHIARAPRRVGAFERLAHHLRIADAFEGVVRAAGGQLHQMTGELLDALRIDEVGRAELACDGFLGRIGVDADDPLRARQASALHDIQSNAAKAEDHDRAASFDLGREQRPLPNPSWLRSPM